MTIQEQKPLLERLAKGIAALFGEHCEVTIHDLTGDVESSIIAIENGEVTGRHIGDGASERVLDALSGDDAKVQDEYCYLARTKEGRMIKSSSIFIKDEKGRPIGLFGINYDITDLIMAQRAIDSTVSVEKPQDEASIGAITTNVSDLLDILIEEADAFIGKPVAMMNKEDKTRAIQYLSERGAFLVKKAGDKVSKHYGISKYTLYNYMDA
ncbi:helix-turn-helix transcriptional regulator [Ruminococcaceae bacterium OttesenSCG-928-O06]|nr:helix-turn-helix transcriptional regulator [Ruminococcaceae bacterium OttesenSCG-928-O06]